ncbi:MAG: tRNA lysidine(34) synthetase TilS [Paracoccaceae bacterium]
MEDARKTNAQDRKALNALLKHTLASALAPHAQSPIGIAVSGGGDSTALLLLAADWAAQTGADLRAITINHGLRKEAADEAGFVAKLCAGLNIPHDSREWTGWAGKGNLQDQARRARQELISAWADELGIKAVALGHTADDQAETFLMRLARRSGVDGLAAMAPQRESHGITWLRPLLLQRREDLRDYLRDIGQDWCEDPSNQDPKFDRIKARQALAALAPLGVDADALMDVSLHMRSAAHALSRQAQDTARRIARFEGGDILFDLRDLDEAGPEIAHRLLSAALRYVASADYGPRSQALSDALSRLRAGQTNTLHGCVISSDKITLRIGREPQAARKALGEIGGLWDGRWCIEGPQNQSLRLRALSEDGLLQLPDWRATGLARSTLAAMPSLWKGAQLFAAPSTGLSNGYTARLVRDKDVFFTSLLSH